MDTEAMIDKLIKKYENIYKNTTVMDDYDGGMMHMVREILADLKRYRNQRFTKQCLMEDYLMQ